MSTRRLIVEAAASTKLPEDATPNPPAAPYKDPAIADISIDDLLGKSLLILYRETRHLLGSSKDNKLSKDDAACVRDNIKLLQELKKREQEVLDELSDEELEEVNNR